MRGRGLRSVLMHMSQADEKADVVLLNVYKYMRCYYGT